MITPKKFILDVFMRLNAVDVLECMCIRDDALHCSREIRSYLRGLFLEQTINGYWTIKPSYLYQKAWKTHRLIEL